MLGNQFLVGQFLHFPTAVGENHLVIGLIDFRVADNAEEGRQAGAGGDQVQVLAGQQVVLHQGAGGLLVDQQLVAGLDILQA